MSVTFTKVQPAAPLKLTDAKVFTILRDNDPTLSAMRFAQEDEPQGLTACYERLSSEDRGKDKAEDESNSIATQKKILERYCKEHGYTGIRHYEDDGYSGTNFQRPRFQEMLADIKAGKIARVLVKDMSRLGRDYLQVGMYTDIIFPEFGVHFLAVNDGVDSTRGENEFTAIRNVFNEMFARDTSKKVRASYQSKSRSGEHVAAYPPYGFKKDPERKGKWLVDEEPAAVVQKIYSLCIDGFGPSQIAVWLWENKIPCPSAYAADNELPCPKKPPKDPYSWSTETVSTILRRLEYLGHTVNFRKTKQSYKSKKIIFNDPGEWAIFENTQEPIIEEHVFWTVQNIRQGRRRKTRTDELDMFTGLLYCVDCGGKLYRQYKQNPSGKVYVSYSCKNYRGKPKIKACTQHYISGILLNDVILRDLREGIAFVTEYEDDFIRDMADDQITERDRELAKGKAELAKAETRIAELDAIFKRIYEDNISGKLTDERFIKLSGDYEREQDALKDYAAALRRDIKEREKRKTDARQFVAVAKKYTDLQELDATVLRELIEKIEVYEKDKQTGAHEVDITYNFIGAFDFQQAAQQAQQTKQDDFTAKMGVA